MLLNLTVTNFAIIDRLEVEFDLGFTVLTGETGAGKSIILDAFGLLLGDRARPDLIRAGAMEATVQALFDLSGQAVLQQLFVDSGFPVGDELVLRRVVQNGGRSRAYINGSLVTLAQLQPLTEQLVTVCGQHEHQHLMHRQAHLTVLDAFGSLDEQVSRYQESYQAMRHAARRLEDLESAEREREQRLDFLRHQSAEIAAADLSLEEEAALQAERVLLQNAERLSTVTRNGYDGLYENDGSVCEVLGRISADLQTVAALDKNLAALDEAVRRTLFELEDVAAQMRSYLERISFDPERIDAIEARLNLLNRLKRKYAPGVEELLKLKAVLDQEIVALEQAGETRAGLASERTLLSERTLALGRKLSEARHLAADKLAAALTAELADLAMAGAQFEVAFTEREQPAAEGLERLEFMISLNPGEPLMPLTKVASGGELSRLMLALKRVAPGAGRVPTIIFDEVDAGIGGVAATAVGRKLRSVSQSAQVLCVTHLPQVAAFADHHHRVIKREEDGRTMASVERLTGEDRVEEMARMLGGAQVTQQTRLHAQELITGSARSGTFQEVVAAREES